MSKYTHQYQPIELPESFPVHVFDYAVPRAPVERLHIHNCVELGLCLSGTGLFLVENKVIPFQTGDVFLIAGSEYHKAFSTGETDSEWTFLQYAPSFLLQPESDGVFDAASLCGAGFPNRMTSPRSTAWLQSAVEELRAKRPGYKETVRSLLRCLTVEAQRFVTGEPMHRNAGNFAKLAPALDDLAKHYAKPLNTERLARLCAMSRSTFFREFRKAFRTTPGEYQISLRIQMGAYLLRQAGHSVQEAAAAVGYTGSSTFFRHFRKKYGFSPCQYRNRPESSTSQSGI